MIDPDDLLTYLTSKDIKAVADASRRMDEDFLRGGQMTKQQFLVNTGKSDKQIYMERNAARDNKKGPS